MSYNPETGVFTRLSKRQNGRTKLGDPAGTHNTTGHIQMMVNGKLYLAHRLAWLYMKGAWPETTLDHINRVRDDNRFCNIRLATHQQNMHNKGKYKNNTTGVVGVYRVPSGKYSAAIGCGGKFKHLGTYESFEDAVSARLAAQQVAHPFSGPTAYT